MQHYISSNNWNQGADLHFFKLNKMTHPQELVKITENAFF